MATQELIERVCPKIRDLGWAHYFAPGTVAVGERLGLDIFTFYFLGRGGVLGDVPAEVVTHAFGYFTPSLVEQMWDAGRQKVAPRQAALAYFDSAADLGRERFGAVGDLETFCQAAGSVNDAADATGLTLYSAARSMPLAPDVPGRSMQLLSLLREFRGSAHLLAVRASGLDAKTAHFITRPGDIAMFGWSEDDAPVITDIEREKLAAAERLTDQLVLPAYAVLDAETAGSFATALDEIEAALTASP